MRLWLQTERSALKQKYLSDADPAQMLVDHASLIDKLLTELWQDAAIPADAGLVAVGGYGRGQLYPFSDVDILLLIPDNVLDSTLVKIEKLVSTLWDCGLEVGHSVRSVQDCIDESKKDVTIETTMMEARLICGNEKLFSTMRSELVRNRDVSHFFAAKLDEQTQRHARFQDTAFNLEPNVKESPGGLRDLHNILWLSQAAQCGASWQELAQENLITPFEARVLARRERLLQNIRIRLHYLANRREDRLLFDYQNELAAEMHVKAKRGQRISEGLMRAYYRNAKVIGQLNTILLQNLSARIDPNALAQTTPINDDFQSRNNLLEAIDLNLFNQRPTAILEVSLLLQQHIDLKGVSAETLRALWRTKNKINFEFRSDEKNQALFMQILRQPQRVTFVLRRMNQYGILGRYIPAFGKIVGQMQHDLFHVYTVDEHILMVLRNLRRFAVAKFAHEFPFCSKLYNAFDKPELLLIAALFHDIAKGRGGDHSELGMVDARRFGKRHGLPEEDWQLVVWLVASHLKMSAVAQKQDLSDPDVIRKFAEFAGNERWLTALYLLTVADIRGTSPKVWNAWKAKLIEDLYRASLRVLRDGEAIPADANSEKKEEALRALRQYAISDEASKKTWTQLDDRYFQRFEAQEIAWHTRSLLGRSSAPNIWVKARLSPIGEGIQVLIYTPDQKGLFARICAFFERQRYDIINAKIYTTRHNYALDSFQIMETSDATATHYRDILSFIETSLAERIAKQAPIDMPGKARISRHLRAFPIEPAVVIEPDERRANYQLSITAGDRPGLLSQVAQVLLRHDLTLQDARIVTLGERVEDTLVISGANLADSAARENIQSDLLEVLRT
ncbi:MAG: bifunctional uridylyltransferase/uridylyl-removing enzyme [Pseudomonadota bacterium]|jgi:[protein-PII] uridylyltransferase